MFLRQHAAMLRASDLGAFRSGGLAMSDTTAQPVGVLDRYFGLSLSGTSLRTEFIAGATTFLTMVYIVFVNPQILGKAGMDTGAVFVATCIASAVSTMVMALYANYPIALAPGMGLNAFFAFTVVLGYKYTWQQALAAVFCSGALFVLLALLFSPLAGMVPAYATSAALLYVACVMTQGLAEIDWSDLTEYAPAVVTAVTMPLTYSIATGIGLGFITHALAKIISGKFAEAKPAVVVLAILFGVKFAIAG
jgi:xanthine/uracil/vitamin C permease (AzgA family)